MHDTNDSQDSAPESVEVLGHDEAEYHDLAAREHAGTSKRGPGLSRRGLFGLLGAGGAGIVVGAGAGAATAMAITRADAAPVYPFFGEHQQGIATPVPDSLVFASLDMAAGTDADDLRELLDDWTFAASRLTQGLEVAEDGATGWSPEAPPPDTGEAIGLRAAGLTITFGFGPSLFDERFGLAARKPAALQQLQLFPGDLIDDSVSGGDLAIQACADDPQVALHAVRNLLRIAFGRAQLRWLQSGFNRSAASAEQQGTTPRNLLGFKDGSANLDVRDDDAMREHVWVGDADQPWLRGGSYLVVRKIRMTVEIWDRTRLAEQERIFGRDKVHGAPLTGGGEFDDFDFSKRDTAGEEVIAADAHVRLAHPDFNDGVRILRRPFNYVDGVTDVGQLDSGLFFLSFQNDPANFTKLQLALQHDGLNEYIRHIGSAVFAVPPGVPDGGSLSAIVFGQ